MENGEGEKGKKDKNKKKQQKQHGVKKQVSDMTNNVANKNKITNY